ncbi:hypothetical protein [Rhizomonospora bruguierae]|uniref:hypothetical protein n=1 Tax=Rhizomonospora bruguierae TaxID=1581705 RepID=UPI001BCC8658|nr:hypothetical protein [Micromonospora sp. NBRC 107566]
MADVEVSVESVARALRRVRPGAYRIGDADGAVTVTLALRVSAGGRRNAAERIVAALAGSGLALAGEDPVQALADGGRLAVRRHPVFPNELG